MVAHNTSKIMQATIKEGDIDDSIKVARWIKHKSNSKGVNVKKWENAPAIFRLPKAGWPTEAPPGTIEKVLVMMDRASRDEELCHPYDCKVDDDYLPLMFYLMEYEKRQTNKIKEK